MTGNNFIYGLILGVTLFTVVTPLLNFIGSLFEILQECITSKASVYITSNNAKIRELSEPEEVGTHAIGFQIDSEDEYYDEDDGCEDKLKHKVGFR